MSAPVAVENAGMVRVCGLDELAESDVVVVVDSGVRIAVFRAEDELFAVDDKCTHQDAYLSDGWLEGCAVECPLHASTFDLRTGKPSGPPAKLPVRTHDVVVDDDVIYVRINRGRRGRMTPVGQEEQ